MWTPWALDGGFAGLRVLQVQPFGPSRRQGSPVESFDGLCILMAALREAARRPDRLEGGRAFEGSVQHIAADGTG